MNMKLLIVEDEPRIGQDLRQGLQGMLEGRDAEARSFEALAAPSRSDEATV